MIRCTNCPSKPVFPDMDAFKTHWNLTHTVSMQETVELPANVRAFFPEAVAKSVKWYEEVP